MREEKVKVTQSCLTLCDPVDCTVHGILQARILEWVAFPFSRAFSQPRDWTQVSRIAGRFFTSWATREQGENQDGEKPSDFERKKVTMSDNPIQVTLHINRAVRLFPTFEGLCETSLSPIRACRNTGQLSPALKRKWSSHHSQQKSPKCSTWMQS